MKKIRRKKICYASGNCLKILWYFFFLFFLSVCLAAPLRAENFVAFSLGRAENILQAGGQPPDIVKELGGIRKFAAVVYQKDTKDLILVGQKTTVGRPVTLDDLVVALRAALVLKEVPLVSIDKNKDTKTTKLQTIRFEGGIGNSQYGKDFLDADVVLKGLALGNLPTEIWGFASYFDLFAEKVKLERREVKVSSLFWFDVEGKIPFSIQEGVGAFSDRVPVYVYPKLLTVNENEAGKDSSLRDEIGEQFATDLSRHMEELSLYYPAIMRLKQLFEVYAIAMCVNELPDKPDVHYWLTGYPLKEVPISPTYTLVEREKPIDEASGLGVRLDGGIRLKPRLQKLLEVGDVTALRDIVISSRPNASSLSWEVPLEGWHIPGGEDTVAKSTEKRSAAQETSSTGFQLTAQTITRLSQGLGDENTIKALASVPKAGVPGLQVTQTLPLTRSSNGVGGVMLSGTSRPGSGQTAQVDLADGNFSLVVDGENARLDPEMYRKFVTALWAVYFGRTDPGISIDPIYTDPETGGFSPKHMVRYIGRVVNSDLGRVMREADYQMKKWSVGTERANVPGFKTPDDYAGRTGTRYLSLSRFWLTPENMSFRTADNMLLFDAGNMTVKTEVLGYNIGEKPADPYNKAFAKFFTEHYGEIARMHPIYRELDDYGKLVALAKYLKDSRIPLLWFLMANMDQVLTEDSPGTVDNLARESAYWEGISIQGGVDMAPPRPSQYVYDATAVQAIEEARRKEQTNRGEHSTSLAPARARSAALPTSFGLGAKQYSVTPQHSLTSGKDRRGLRYQTDLCLRAEGYKVTDEVVAVLKSEILRQAIRRELLPVIEKMSDEELKKQYETMVARSFEKAKKIVKPFQDKVELLKGKEYETEADCGQAWEKAMGGGDPAALRPLFVQWCHYVTNLELVRYFNPDQQGMSEFGKGWRLLIPYRVKPGGEARTEFMNATLPREMQVENLITGDRETLTFSTDRYSIAGYVPPEGKASQLIGLFLLSDASFRLVDKRGSEFHFDQAGWLTEMALSDDHQIKIEYLAQGTDSFGKPPYYVEMAGNDRVELRGASFPKRMKVKDLIQDVTEILVFSDKGSTVGYVPEKPQGSRYQILAPLTNGSFRLLDKHGNEVAFSPGGVFEKMIPGEKQHMVRAISSGGHQVFFNYTIGSTGELLIAGAKLKADDKKAKPTYLVRYEYDREDRLSAAKRSRIGERVGQSGVDDQVVARRD